MIFKKVALEFTAFDEESMHEIKRILQTKCPLAPGPLADFRIQESPERASKKMSRAKRRDQDFVIKDLILALGLCHNVTPVYEQENGKTVREFQASSPDEVALVKFADSMGIQLLERDQKTIVIQPPGTDQKETYEILDNFPFSSDTKRMGIILRHVETDTYMFYLKGAEVVMQNLVRPSQRDCILEHCENLAREGLRTLVITQKQLQKEEFQRWAARYNEAKADMNNRKEAMKRVLADLESEMELLGVTGVEDKLQDNVASTIESLRLAGI